MPSVRNAAPSELDEEFCDLCPDEYQSLRVLGMLIEKLAMSPTIPEDRFQ